MTHYEKLYQQYPNALFVLIRRNITNHINSISHWGNGQSSLRERLWKGDLPYLPRGKGQTDEEIRIWIEGHYRRVHDYFTRNAPDQYLEIQLEDDDDSKAKFIRKFTHCHGNISMIHRNINTAKRKRRFKTFRERHPLDESRLAKWKQNYDYLVEEMGFDRGSESGERESGNHRKTRRNNIMRRKKRKQSRNQTIRVDMLSAAVLERAPKKLRKRSRSKKGKK